MIFGIGNNVKSRVVRTCTPELFHQAVDSRKVAQVCADIVDARELFLRGELTKEEFETKKAELKKRLPILTPHATFRNERRLNAEAIPSGMSMYDLDHIPNPQERWAEIAPRKEALGIVLAHITPSTEGLRLFFVMPQGMSLGEAQAWMAKQLGDTTYDVCVKDYARSSFLVPREYVLFVDEERLFGENVLHTPPASATSPNLGEESVTGSPSKLEGVPRRGEGVCETTHNHPTHYKGVPYTEILHAIAEELGGEPEEGERNAKVLRMASSLRHICDNNAEWLMEIIPTYGLPEEEWKKTIQNACKDGLKYGTTKVLQNAFAKLKIEDDSALSTQNSELSSAPPKMPSKLPPLIELLTSRTPEIYKPAVAHAVFPALGVHLHNTTFRYIDNVRHEATLMNVLMAPTGAGKNCITEPINRIMADIRVRDEENLAREKAWKDEVNRKGANKDKRQRPEGLVIQEIDADMTNPAFVMRMAEADGHFLYTRLNEIDQFNALKGNGKAGQHFQIMCLAFDPNNRYGQTRVGTQSVTEKVTIRFNWNASTTIDKGVKYFNGVLTDGPISRINFCTIPEREIGAEMPIYGTYNEAFDEQLAPYIERLVAANGLVDCPEAYALAKRLRDESAEVAIKSQDRTYENLSFRANVIAYLKACVLHVAHGGWDESFDEFIRWSKEYDLWCKMHFFGAAIEAEEERGRLKRASGSGQRLLLDELPKEFGYEQVAELYARIGRPVHRAKDSIKNWVRREFIVRLDNKRFAKIK